MKTKLAVIVLARNEERNIGDCLRSAAFADELLVIDSGSRDRTREQAEAAGARWLLHPMDETGFAGQRNFALSQTEADWVFYLDADERVDDSAREAILAAVRGGEQAAYAIERQNIVFGQRMGYGDHRPDKVVRLFPRSSVRWEGAVHERPVTELPRHRLAGHLDHYTYTDWERYFDKFNQYTSLMARRMLEEGKGAGFLDILLHPLFAFCRFYFLRLGFLDGKQGFIFAAYHYFYTMAKYVKLYYWQRGR